ncbi:MAG: Gfo/Idh/MocA family oxidoreductase [Flavobacteriaceae bacterium]|nr:Gfo/Idh/MocA family oxidoreductase [Flavobacteriaceae bacterium]
MLKVGVIGVGHLGEIHLKLLQQSDKYELIGFYDADLNQQQKIASSFNCIAFQSLEKLMDAVDVVDIVTPTLSHFDCAQMAIKKGKHIFIEKPITNTVDEALELISLAEKYQVKGQVGHVERFNPAFLASKDFIKNPMFIEIHRLEKYNIRGTDVPVVLDLMIHDLDIILNVVKSKVKKITANGIAVMSKSPDIANARIEFENGCVANLTASRISMKNMRKSRFFQKDAYISVDFLNKTAEIVRLKAVDEHTDDFAMILQDDEGIRKQLYFENPEITLNNAILDELDAFADAINQNTNPIVSLQQGAECLKLAIQIINSYQK